MPTYRSMGLRHKLVYANFVGLEWESSPIIEKTSVSFIVYKEGRRSRSRLEKESRGDPLLVTIWCRLAVPVVPADELFRKRPFVKPNQDA